MNTLKRHISVLLALVLALLLCCPALASGKTIPGQTVKVDGKAVSVQPYPIDGYNYFKLRDMAQLLDGTDSRFEVSYSAGEKRMYVTTGKAYTSVGGELALAAGSDFSYAASDWTLAVDGKAVSCSVYTIAGNNYFKLRDLGNAIGFGVSYDAASHSVLITTAPAGEGSASWKPDISFTTTDAAGTEWTDACFEGHELTMINYWAYWCSPCVEELPDIQKLSQDFASKGVQVLGIFDADSYSEKKNLEKISELSLTYPQLRYVSEFDAALQSGYMPTTIFVDGDGHVVGEAYIGSRSYSSWSSVINGLLK